MVAFNDPPTLTCVTTTAVRTAHSGKCSPANCATARESVAAKVTRTANPSCTRRRLSQARISLQMLVARCKLSGLWVVCQRAPATAWAPLHRGAVMYQLSCSISPSHLAFLRSRCTKGVACLRCGCEATPCRPGGRCECRRRTVAAPDGHRGRHRALCPPHECRDDLEHLPAASIHDVIDAMANMSESASSSSIRISPERFFPMGAMHI